MKTYAFIFARGGSKGVPGKNIRELAGRPLLVYSVDLARKVEQIDKIFVSTDDQKIAAVAAEHGAQIIDRPFELAQDDTPEWLAWQHSVEWLQDRGDSFDVFISLPATSPLGKKQDILLALESLDENTDLVLTMTKAVRSPWFNMIKKTNSGYIELLMQHEQTPYRRQDVPKVYNVTTVAYVTRPQFIKSARGVFEGKVKGVEIPAERALDIDSELDFVIAEFLIHRMEK